MQGTTYLLTRIMQLEGDKAVLLNELDKLRKEVDAIKKEVQPNGNDRTGRTVDKTESIGRTKTS